MARPRNVKIDALLVEPLSDWTVEGTRGALRMHELGRFRLSARLADAMGRCPRISGALETRVRALTSRSALPFAVETSDEGDGRKRSAAAERMRALWWNVCPEDATAPLLRDAIMLGAAIGFNAWSDDWVPRLHWLPPHGLSFEDYALDGTRRHTWVYAAADGKRYEVTPGDGTWFLYLPNGPRSWMQGRIRQLGIPWLMSTWTERDWARYNEKHGLPILSIDEPYNAQDDVEGSGGANGSLADAYYAQFKNLPNEAVLRNPQGQTKDEPGWSAKWLEPVSDTWTSFKDHLAHYGSLVDQSLLGRDSSAGPKGGDGELATERVRVEYLSADAESFSTALREQVWKPDAEFNFGDRDVAGWGRWNTRPAPDFASRASTLKALGEALEKLLPMGIDGGPIAEEFGLTGTVKAPPQPSSPAPATE